MEFIVTGCNGYIGSHMCYELRKEYPDCKIYGLDRIRKPHLEHLYDTFINTDIASNHFTIPTVNAIFHFAAFISVEEGEKEPLKYYYNNVVGSLNLIKESVAANIPHFIFSSTAAVYGEWNGTMFGLMEENQNCRPTSVYGKTKYMVEQVLETQKKMNVARLRYFNACGRNVEAGLYEEHDPETHLIPLLARNSRATIYGNDWPTEDGTCIRDYVHVVDICRAHILVYKYMYGMSRNYFHVNEAFNIGTGNGYSVKSVVSKANKIIHNNNMIIEYKDRRPGDVPYLVADSAKLRNTTGWSPRYDLNDIIESMKE